MGNDADRMGTKKEQTEEADHGFLCCKGWFQHSLDQTEKWLTRFKHNAYPK